MHWNPWEKIDKATFMKILEQSRKAITKYESYEFMTKKIVPATLHEAIMKLAGGVKRCENFYAYYQDAKAVYDALEVLNKTNMNDSLKAANAFGALFVSLGGIAEKGPFPLPQYAPALKVIGGKFGKIVEMMMPTHGHHEYDALFADPQNQKNY